MSPCLPRSSAAPHVRVNPDQEFLIEWASGHPGSYHYLVVLKATDEAQMATHSEAMLNDYLDTAPAAATLTGVYHRKLHYGWTAKSRAGGDEPTEQSRRLRRRMLVQAKMHDPRDGGPDEEPLE